MQPAPGDDHRKRPRRRGDVLNRAIFEAAVAELTETGYERLTMGDVARRARTSKASLYRRWPSRADLVVDALRNLLPDSGHLPDTGDLRADLIAFLGGMAERLNGPVGIAVRGLIADTMRDPELTEVARSRIVDSPPELVLRILRRAVDRGEALPSALTHQVALTGPVLLRHHFLVYGTPIPDKVIVEIVDEVVLPLVRRPSAAPEQH